MLTTAALGLLAFVLGGVGRRICGGALNQWVAWQQVPTKTVVGDLPVRLFFGATGTAAVLLSHGIGYAAVLMCPAMFVGTTTGNFNSLAMGHGGRPLWKDFLGMSLHALLSALLPCVLAYLFGWNVCILFLLTMTASPCYMIGWAIAGPTGILRMPPGMRTGTEFAEFLWGGMCCLGAYVSVLMGGPWL